VWTAWPKGCCYRIAAWPQPEKIKGDKADTLTHPARPEREALQTHSEPSSTCRDQQGPIDVCGLPGRGGVAIESPRAAAGREDPGREKEP